MRITRGMRMVPLRNTWLLALAMVAWSLTLPEIRAAAQDPAPDPQGDTQEQIADSEGGLPLEHPYQPRCC